MKKLTLLMAVMTFALVNWAQIDQDDKIIDIEYEDAEELVENDEVFLIVEQMPCLPGCSSIEDNQKRAECSKTKMREAIYKNVVYPELAIDQNIQGKVFVGFVINKEGDVEDVSVLRGVDPILNNAAISAVKKLPKFTPGMQKGKVVKVRFNVPVTFRLN